MLSPPPAPVVLSSVYFERGVTAGAEWRSSNPPDPFSAGKIKETIFDGWNRIVREHSHSAHSGASIRAGDGVSYAKGFFRGAGIGEFPVAPVALKGKAVAVVCTAGEEYSLYSVMEQLTALPLDEIVVILYGPADGKFYRAKGYANTIVVFMPELTDADVGRALGANLADAETVLLVDGNAPVPAERLAEMLEMTDGRADITLADTPDNDSTFIRRNAVLRFQEFLNATLDRPELRTNSFSQLPLALSRHALNTLGAAVLTVPTVAHAMALLKGLKIGLVRVSDVSPVQRENALAKSAGDHMEAWREAMSVRGGRLEFADTYRNRSVLGGTQR
ncbi:hypothetical protein ACFPVX_13145 [Cohnella faecalis]|uniref:hypothetical protein n=1 Tax=Cohnella faecalis TaxID=2315694 RepID=UPI0011C21E92|nr:hypothetical protein [Cohnella faecalis]